MSSDPYIPPRVISQAKIRRSTSGYLYIVAMGTDVAAPVLGTNVLESQSLYYKIQTAPGSNQWGLWFPVGGLGGPIVANPIAQFDITLVSGETRISGNTFTENCGTALIILDRAGGVSFAQGGPAQYQSNLGPTQQFTFFGGIEKLAYPRVATSVDIVSGARVGTVHLLAGDGQTVLSLRGGEGSMSWTALPTPPSALRSIRAVRDAYGFEVLAIDSGNRVQRSYQPFGNSNWSAWQDIGEIPSITSMFVIRKHNNGTLEDYVSEVGLFAWDDSRGYRYWSRPSGPNGVWETSGFRVTGAPGGRVSSSCAAFNVNGVLEVFSVASQRVHHCQQQPNGGWGDWSLVPGSDSTPITQVDVAADPGGLLHLAGVGADGLLWTNFQTDRASLAWSGWQRIRDLNAGAASH